MKAKKCHDMMKSRALAFLLIFMMCAWLWPWNLMEVQAATATELKNPRVTVNSSGDVEKATWDCVYFGNYPQGANGESEQIKWRVLSVDGDEALLLADKNLDCKKYNETNANVTWETSTVRSWLNGYGTGSNQAGKDYTGDNFMDAAFSTAEQAAINQKLIQNPNNSGYGTAGGSSTTDNVFFLSIEEATNSDYGFSKDYGAYDKARRALNTEYAKSQGAYTSTSTEYAGNGYWWLRSPGSDSLSAAFVYYVGYVYRNGNGVCYGGHAVRPALFLNLKSNLWSYAGTVSSDGTVNEVESVLRSPQTTSGGKTTWDCVWFGNYKQSSEGNGNFKKEPIKWRVLSVSGDDAFLLADQNLDCKAYNEIKASVTWETCTLRSWLNGGFINEAFSPDEQQAIQVTDVVNKNNPTSNTNGGSGTTDRVYLLSIDEVEKTAYGFSSNYGTYDEGRCAKNTDYAQAQGASTSGSSDYEGNGYWWLRSPGSDARCAAYVDINGSVSRNGFNVYISSSAVRPVLHLNLRSDCWSYAGTVANDGTINEEKPTYKISYDANGGTGAPSEQTKTYDQTLTLSGIVPTREGYDFLGWSESKATNTVKYAAGGSYTNNNNVTLYAVWKERPKPNEGQGSGTSQDKDKQNNTQRDGQTTNGKLTQTISASSKTLTYKGKTVSLNAKTNGNGRLSYSSSNQKVVTVSGKGKVTPKECGSAEIAIKAAETSQYKAAVKTITVKVLPKKPALKLKRIRNLRVRASWTKTAGASGYCVYMYRYDTKKTSVKKTRKRSANAALVKGKKYQFKVRAYRKVGKKTVYGSYSKAIKIKC